MHGKRPPASAFKAARKMKGVLLLAKVRGLESPTTPMVGSSHCRDFLRALSLNCPFLLKVPAITSYKSMLRADLATL